MPVIEAQRASILVPHDHRHINQIRATPGAHRAPICTPQVVIVGDQPTAPIGGSARGY
jgi:hypothetical protein